MKFITPVSMPCTREQYEADLKKPLEEMGYPDKFGKPILGKCPFEIRSMLLSHDYCVNNFKEK